MTGELDRTFNDAERWHDEALALRDILLDCELTEVKKWGKPCYTQDGANIAIMQRMKGFLALLFVKGGLLKDPDGILAPQGPNSRAGYRAVFTSVEDVTRMADSLRGCVREAIEVQKKGLKVEPSKEIGLPDELVDAMDSDPDLASAFHALTPGRQRGYALHIANAKQSSTRIGRIEKNRAKILAGKGLHDR
ncbi:YdeI family protein [Henriciella sp.]|uniref:YdeI/OmpD-associated family protein n=1 Tax=Henriciella sp. TaxID=1968823 RepID=UPI00262C6D09|nr:YdeI/OmpD-associated family protein [Henriciella sp.]